MHNFELRIMPRHFHQAVSTVAQQGGWQEAPRQFVG